MTARREGRILFEGVWKQFRRGEMHDSLRDLVPALFRGLAGRTGRRVVDREFWALQDISFEVRPGEALGIIGANGAGKSTTLKILTRILEPTRGRYLVEGRIGALLEVAAGFHADLTGRENIYLQGAIMGMKTREIAARFDEIVAFSGVEEFIDTPVKRFSSGMNARLGFAVAAHLDPDVLIIDEVLAVGDYVFQQKAYDRIRTMVKSGIPVVLVSHQLDRVASLCSRVILLDHGRVALTGSPEECIAHYVSGAGTGIRMRRGNEDIPVEFTRLAVTPDGPIISGGEIAVRLGVRLHDRIPDSLDPVAFRVISAASGREVFATSSRECGITLPDGAGLLELVLTLQLNLPAGLYMIEVVVVDWTKWINVANGPMCYVQVVPGIEFRGLVQMHARLTSGPLDNST